MFADASRSKVLELRAREDNPARDVAGPDRGIERSGPYLFPAEFLAIVRCARIPARWKRLVTFSLYAGLRRGELAALEWGDVHVDQRYFHVHRAEGQQGTVKATKSGRARKVPIEPALVPLLERMREQSNGEGLLMTSMPPAEEMAKRLRRYLEWSLEDAGMPVREELFADDATRKPLVWHDLRHGYGTWRAIRGDDAKKIQRGMGHAEGRTTDLYINEAETFESPEAFGVPFPPLDVATLTAIEGGGGGSRSFGSTFGISDRAAARKPANPGAIGRPQGDTHIADAVACGSRVVVNTGIAGT